mmetsp:Transcript_10047/g.16461  ORF Transcript_10047/g.16461 Transcript_10047/m.16461 type:complete len:110 (-) Transcript_10047:1326-1655(-)|eukprot:CAMPEP_0203774850 /NCGR_PEP_ID=MMETSP0099_2-20121227/5644_1 /ASSEMBLY_ACC=CAM_ASM_000209 /TAXON_ID=96639 /ORGANISM=" , Strain NY0313808BC1" /LENGTH=109 /DNA_ID=CAMNT_0050673241 /DNA_START=558 /DNA_END=887 /DNA_ORIENTATION=-
MDVMLDLCEEHFFEPYVYDNSTMPMGSLERQSLSLWVMTTLGGWALYLVFAGLNFCFVFDKTYLKHPKILNSGESGAQGDHVGDRCNTVHVAVYAAVFFDGGAWVYKAI